MKSVVEVRIELTPLVVNNMNSLSHADMLISQVDIWHCCTAGMVFEDEKRRYECYLTTEEQEKVAHFLFEKDRLNCLFSRVLLRLALSWYYPCIDAIRWHFAIGSSGKPYLDLPMNEQGIEFNISHSGNVVVCAITRVGSVGIDIETAKIMSDVQGFSRRFLAPEEFFSVRNRFISEQSQFFFRLWTLKEAYLKAIGSGLGIPLNSFCFDCDSLDSKQIALLYGASSTHCWRFWQFFYSDDRYPVALAVSAEKPIKIMWREPELIGLSQY
jgi:4'-phosphopantetheinyl transferase